MGNRNRNTAILFITAGVFFALGKLIGFSAVSAALLIWLGLYKVRTDGGVKGYAVLALGTVLLIGHHLSIVVALVLFSLGYFFIKSKKVHNNGEYVQHQTIVESLRWDSEPWVLTNMSRWSLLTEARLDLSLALREEQEVTVMLQGLVGDIDIIVPEEYGVSVEASVWLGRIGFGSEKDSGLLNKRNWQSPHYAESAHKVKLIFSFAVGDIEIKLV